MTQGKKYDLLILDYGGVYAFEYDAHSFDTVISVVFGRSATPSEKISIYEQAHLLGANKITSTEYVSRVANILRVANPQVAFFEKTAFSYSFMPAPEMVQLVKLVRDSGVQVSLLSDMYIFEVLKSKREGRFDGFDHLSFSAEIGFTKNSVEAFRATLTHFNFEPAQALFIDDVYDYTENARAIGMDAIWVDKASIKDVKQLAAQIRQKLNI